MPSQMQLGYNKFAGVKLCEQSGCMRKALVSCHATALVVSKVKGLQVNVLNLLIQEKGAFLTFFSSIPVVKISLLTEAKLLRLLPQPG